MMKREEKKKKEGRKGTSMRKGTKERKKDGEVDRREVIISQ